MAQGNAEEVKTVCTVPPEGWWCSRDAGHEGPCAAREIGEPWDGSLTAPEQAMLDRAWERHKAARPEPYATLEAADRWLEQFAEHASYCAGNPGDCRCGLNHVRARNAAALANARGDA